MPEVGKRYEVEGQDCCVSVWFIAVCTSVGEDQWDTIEWDNGVRISGYAVTFTEVT